MPSGCPSLMKKIAFLIPYFGPFPPWMEYFLASCRANASVDFILFSDNPCPSMLPANVHYREMAFKAYQGIVRSKLGIGFYPRSAYKLCDLKPALGFIHEDLLRGYDFWGFCDIDVVFGDLRKFLTDNLLGHHDMVTTHARRVAGHFTLLRNTPAYRNAFMSVPDWRGALSDEQHVAFDEKAFSRLFTGFKNYPSQLRKLLCYVFLPLGRKALFRETYSTPGLRYSWVDGSRSFPDEWYWQEGILTNDKSEDEFLYFHFLKWKRDWGSNMYSSVPCNDIEHCWKVTKYGFEPVN